MARPTQLWPGERMRTFFRSIFRGETGVSDALADRLAEVCERHINRMMVWDGRPGAGIKPSQRSAESPEGRLEEDGASKPGAPAHGTETAADNAIEDVSLMEAGAPWPVAPLDGAPALADDGQSSDGQGAEPARAFDPFAFSVVVILARSGAKALMVRLKDIKDAGHLRELADAQHLGVDPGVRGVVKLREAIVRGAKQRLADRRAAAS